MIKKIGNILLEIKINVQMFWHQITCYNNHIICEYSKYDSELNHIKCETCEKEFYNKWKK